MKKNRMSRRQHSITEKENIDYIVCQICGCKRRILTYHLKTEHKITKKEYEKKFGVSTICSDSLQLMRKLDNLYRWSKKHPDLAKEAQKKGIQKMQHLYPNLVSKTMKRRQELLKEKLGDDYKKYWWKTVGRKGVDIARLTNTDWDFYNKYGYKKTKQLHPKSFTGKFKDKIRSLYGNKCVVTGITQKEHLQKYGKKLYVHHWTYDKDETDPFYFVPITCFIHAMTNHNRIQWTDLFNGIAEDKYCGLQINV